MSEPHVLSEVKDGIGTIHLNRPDIRNALSEEMKKGLTEITGRFEKDPAVRCVVISAAGDHFMVGANVKDFHHDITEHRERQIAAFEERVVATNHPIYRLHRMPKPVLISVKGGTVGFGLCLTLASDLVIAADDTYFMLAYRHIGFSPDAAATYLLPRIVGERRALEITMLGERFSAQKGQDWGLVNWVVPRASLEEETAKMARRLADSPTFALGKAKRLLRHSFDHNWDEQLHREAEYITECVASDDHREGVSAFVEKRKPNFTGR